MSEQKVLCPYCGAEMECRHYETAMKKWGVYRCEKCSAYAPHGSDADTEHDARESAREAALRRAPITGDTSDGYHTFNELYHHRATLFSVIVRNYPDQCWKSKQHHDGTMYDGMFIVGIDTPDGQASYHYDIDPYWDMFDCRELENAPEWDGHTPEQAIERIGKLGCAEPANRVLTLDEYIARPEIIFLEANLDVLPAIAVKPEDGRIIVGLWCVDHYETPTGEIMGNPAEDVKNLADIGRPYGKAWRCWLRKPTDEERQSVPWEE